MYAAAAFMLSKAFVYACALRSSLALLLPLLLPLPLLLLPLPLPPLLLLLLCYCCCATAAEQMQGSLKSLPKAPSGVKPAVSTVKPATDDMVKTGLKAGQTATSQVDSTPAACATRT
jgi:hypothetical protein